jgi:hypothetical protein
LADRGGRRRPRERPAAHLFDQQVAHPSGDASNSDAGCHVIPPQSDGAILLARGYGSNCTTGGNWSGCDMAFLLTWHGTLLCRLRQGGGLVHRPPSPVSDDVEPVVLDLPIEQLQPDFGLHLRATLPELPVNPPGELQGFRLGRRSADHHLAARRPRSCIRRSNSDRVTLNSRRARLPDARSTHHG